MTPGIVLIIIGGILLVSGWKGSGVIDTFAGNFRRRSDTSGGSTSATDSPFTSPIPPSRAGDWKAPAGGSHGFKGPNARLLNYLAGIAQNKFGLTITATTNGGHVANSFHYRGEAFDAAGDPDKMNAFSRFVQENFGPSISELIHAPGYAIKDGQNVNGPSVYSRVWDGHRNHVHVAAG